MPNENELPTCSHRLDSSQLERLWEYFKTNTMITYKGLQQLDIVPVYTGEILQVIPKVGHEGSESIFGLSSVGVVMYERAMAKYVTEWGVLEATDYHKDLLALTNAIDNLGGYFTRFTDRVCEALRDVAAACSSKRGS